MKSTRHLVLAGVILGLCAIPVGILAHNGTLTIPLAERLALRGDGAAVHRELERVETIVPGGRMAADSRWRAHLDIVDKELEQGHIDGAVRAWHDAYSAALYSRSWESMIAVGDAFMAIGHASGSTHGARMNAREAYMAALIRARRDRSLDGALRAEAAFRKIGDHAIAEQCLRVAARLAQGDEQAQQRLRDAQQPAAPVMMTEF
jgi:hypothetical protein